MSCQKCGTQNDAAVRQCVKCGAALKPGKPRTPVVVAHVYAGFWKRFAAFIIDYIVVIIVVMGGGAAVGFICGVANGLATVGEIAGTIAGFMAFCLYYVLMESSRTQATLSKLALGIRVKDMRGARISFGCVTWRLISKLTSGMTLMLIL